MRSSPVVGQEQDVRRRDGELQPAPIRDEVGEQREDEEADAEEHLIQDPHHPPELHPHDLCD